MLAERNFESMLSYDEREQSSDIKVKPLEIIEEKKEPSEPSKENKLKLMKL